MSFLAAILMGLASSRAPEGTEVAKPCEQQLPMPTSLLEKNPRFILVGEIHGTDTSPEVFGDIVCALVESRPVLVQFEVPSEFGEAINAFVQTGNEEELEKVLDSWIFKSESYDGRGSAAFLDLIHRLRKMKEDGLDVAVAGAQPSWITIEPQYYYELSMAHLWGRNAGENPDAINMILVGNYHAANAINDRRKSAAGFLRKEDTVTLAPCSEGGTASVLQADGPTIMELYDNGQQLGRGIYPAFRKGEDGKNLSKYADGMFDGYYCAGRPAKASPRAVPAEESAG